MERARRILLVQTSFLGDTVLSTPLIEALSSRYPGARISTLTRPESAEMLAYDPRLEHVLSFDKRRHGRGLTGLRRMAADLREIGFGKAYVLHRSARTALLIKLAGIPDSIGFSQASLSRLYTHRVPRMRASHEVLRNLSLLGTAGATAAGEAELRLFAPERSRLSNDLQTLAGSIDRYVLLVPGSAWATKRWHAEGYRKVAEEAVARGFSVFVSGTAEEREYCAPICEGPGVHNLAGRMSVAELLYFVKHAQLVVCNDSAAQHIAAAFKTPAVVVFCATSPSFGFGPWNAPARVVEKEGLLCKPCGRHGPVRCPLGTELCMREISGDRVIQAAGELLDAFRGAARREECRGLGHD